MKIGIAGCMGRVGQILVNELRNGSYGGLEYAGGTVLPKDLATAPESLLATDSADELFERADAVIDFTAPAATVNHAKLSVKHGTILIAGTTGLTAEDEDTLKSAAKKSVIVYAANYSIGVNMLLALVEQAANRLSDGWDIEIFESHHKYMVDIYHLLKNKLVPKHTRLLQIHMKRQYFYHLSFLRKIEKFFQVLVYF